MGGGDEMRLQVTDLNLAEPVIKMKTITNDYWVLTHVQYVVQPG